MGAHGKTHATANGTRHAISDAPDAGRQEGHRPSVDGPPLSSSVFPAPDRPRLGVSQDIHSALLGAGGGGCCGFPREGSGRAERLGVPPRRGLGTGVRLCAAKPSLSEKPGVGCDLGTEVLIARGARERAASQNPSGEVATSSIAAFGKSLVVSR